MKLHKSKVGKFKVEWSFNQKNGFHTKWNPHIPTEWSFKQDSNLWNSYVEERHKAIKKLEAKLGIKIMMVDLGRNGEITPDLGPQVEIKGNLK